MFSKLPSGVNISYLRVEEGYGQCFIRPDGLSGVCGFVTYFVIDELGRKWLIDLGWWRWVILGLCIDQPDL